MRFSSVALAVLVGLIAGAVPGSAQSVPAKSTVARIVDSLASDFVAAHGAPGISIAVVRGRDTVVMNGWGKADLENDVPATAHSVYRIGSITKQFTAAAVMQLVEQHKVSLDDSIGTYLDRLPAAWRVATVRELLNHTSGIPSYTGIGQRWVRRWGEEMSPDTLVALTASDTMWFKPGTSWRYDNSGYVVLGMLIEKITGKPWAANITDRFARPLGLDNTLNCATSPLISHRADGYQPAGNAWQNSPYLAMSQPYAAGALCSTVGDLATWNYDLGNGKVVSAESYREMTTPVGAALTSGSHYGFGLERDTLAGRTVITHNGGINGFSSWNSWFPDDQVSVVILTNSGAANLGPLMAQVSRAALGVPLLQRHRRVAVPLAELARYAGVYALKLGETARDFTFFVRGDTLYAQLAGQGANALIPYGDNKFGASFDPDAIVTFVMVDGKATKVILEQNGRTSEGLRKQ